MNDLMVELYIKISVSTNEILALITYAVYTSLYVEIMHEVLLLASNWFNVSHAKLENI